jgi:hypothetical protein
VLARAHATLDFPVCNAPTVTHNHLRYLPVGPPTGPSSKGSLLITIFNRESTPG